MKKSFNVIKNENTKQKFDKDGQGCSTCRYAEDNIMMCQARLCIHAIMDVYDRYEWYERNEDGK